LQDLRLHLIAPLASAILQLLGLAAQQNRSAAAAWHAAAQPTAAQLQLLDNGYCARWLHLLACCCSQAASTTEHS